MVQFGVLFAFCGYAYLVNRFGYHWRRLGLQSLEYIAGAVIVVSATWAQGGDWLFWIVCHYLIALAVVLPVDITRAARDHQEATSRDREV